MNRSFDLLPEASTPFRARRLSWKDHAGTTTPQVAPDNRPRNLSAFGMLIALGIQALSQMIASSTSANKAAWGVIPISAISNGAARIVESMGILGGVPLATEALLR